MNLSTALREITDAYDRAEARNEQRMEDTPPLRVGYAEGKLFQGVSVRKKIQEILGK